MSHDPRIVYAAHPDSPTFIRDYMHISEREMRRNEYSDWIRTTGCVP